MLSFIIVFVPICVVIFAVIPFFLMYLRSGLKGHILLSVGSAITVIGMIGSIGIKNERLSDLFYDVVMVPGLIIIVIGKVYLYFIESMAVQEAYRGHSIPDIMAGNISKIERKKNKPSPSRIFWLIIGVICIIGGAFVCVNKYPSTSYLGISLITLGLTMLIFSIEVLYNSRIISKN